MSEIFLTKNNRHKSEVYGRDLGRTRLQGHRLLIARILYFTLFGLMIALFIQGIQAHFTLSASGTIGVQITPNQAGEVVLAPLPSQPAGRAGMQPGEVLLAVNGQGIPAGANRFVVHRLLMGPPGKPVTLDVRSPDGSLRQYSIIRDSDLVEQAGFSPASYAPSGPGWISCWCWDFVSQP